MIEEIILKKMILFETFLKIIRKITLKNKIFFFDFSKCHLFFILIIFITFNLSFTIYITKL